MLNTETNTLAMERRIRATARAKLGTSHLRTIFEHGQWWITNSKTGAQYSVVDAEGPGSVDGFDFEEVTAASE